MTDMFKLVNGVKVDLTEEEIEAASQTEEERLAEELLAEREDMVCTRQQGKLAIGRAKWGKAKALLTDKSMGFSEATLWSLEVAMNDTALWHRTNPDMQALIWALGLTDEDADDLFRLAMTL